MALHSHEKGCHGYDSCHRDDHLFGGAFRVGGHALLEGSLDEIHRKVRVLGSVDLEHLEGWVRSSG